MTIKTTVAALAFIIAAGCLASCEDQNVKKLKTEVKVAEASCPLPAGVLGEISAVSYDGSANMVRFTLSSVAGSIDSLFVASHKEECLPLAALALSRGPQAEVLRQMASTGAGAEICYGSSAMLSIPADSVKAILSSPLTGRQADRLELGGYAALISSQCPQPLINGAELVGVSLGDSTLNCRVRTQGPTFTLASVRSNTPMVRHDLWQHMKQLASSPAAKQLFKLCFDADAGIMYEFEDASGSAPLQMLFPAKEVYFLTK